MKYARKIDLPINLDSIKISSKALSYHLTGTLWKEPASIHYYVRDKDKDYIKQCLPLDVRKHLYHIDTHKFTILAPHVHVTELALINLYISVDGEITTVYDGDKDPYNIWDVDNGNGYYLVNPDKINPIETFCASTGDIWILDPTQPHSVTYKDDTRVGIDRYIPLEGVDRPIRNVVQLYFDIPFKELSGMIA